MTNSFIFLVVVFVVLPFISNAQVGGISASKLGTFCTTPVGINNVEFEPAFGVDAIKKEWNNEGDVVNIFSEDEADYNIASGFGFRITYGAFKNFEIGMAFPVSFEETDLGLKYMLFEGDKFSLGLMGGSHLYFSERDVVKKTSPVFQSFAEGIVLTNNFTENLSLDINAQMVHETANSELNNIVFVSGDLGWYFKENYQFVTGLYYNTAHDKSTNLTSSVFAVNAGFCIETGNDFLFVINTPISLFGRNAEKVNSVQLALTITIE